MVNDEQQEKNLAYSDHVNSFSLKEGRLSIGLKMNHEITRVLEEDTLTDKITVSLMINEKHQNIYNHVLLLKLIFGFSSVTSIKLNQGMRVYKT